MNNVRKQGSVDDGENACFSIVCVAAHASILLR